MLPIRERVPGSFVGDPAQQNIQTSGKSLLLSKGYVSTAPATRVPGVGVPLIQGGGRDSGTAQTEPGGPWVAPMWTDDSSSFLCSSALPTCLLAGVASVLPVSTTAVPAKLVSSVVQIWRSPSCPKSSPAQLLFLDHFTPVVLLHAPNSSFQPLPITSHGGPAGLSQGPLHRWAVEAAAGPCRVSSGSRRCVGDRRAPVLPRAPPHWPGQAATYLRRSWPAVAGSAGSSLEALCASDHGLWHVYYWGLNVCSGYRVVPPASLRKDSLCY